MRVRIRASLSGEGFSRNANLQSNPLQLFRGHPMKSHGASQKSKKSADQNQRIFTIFSASAARDGEYALSIASAICKLAGTSFTTIPSFTLLLRHQISANDSPHASTSSSSALWSQAMLASARSTASPSNADNSIAASCRSPNSASPLSKTCTSPSGCFATLLTFHIHTLQLLQPRLPPHLWPPPQLD